MDFCIGTVAFVLLGGGLGDHAQERPRDGHRRRDGGRGEQGHPAPALAQQGQAQQQGKNSFSHQDIKSPFSFNLAVKLRNEA